MAEPEADGRDVYEALEAFGGLVVAGSAAAGIFELVEAALHQVAQPVEGAVHGNAQLAGLPHRDDRHDIARLHGFANLVRVIAAICQQDAGFGQVVVHDQVEP